MKKRNFTAAAALAIVLALAGCGNKPAGTTTTADGTTATADGAATTTSAEIEVTTTAAETEDTGDTKEIDVPLTDSGDDEDAEGTLLFTDLSGNKFYREDATEGDWDITLPYTSVRVSSGMFIDSDKNPELFDTENFKYSGDRAACGDLVKVKAGDTIGGLKIAKASTRVNLPWSEEKQGPDHDATEGFMIGGSSVDIEGEVVLTGILRYYYNEMYTISSGDMIFVPDGSYSGMPMATNILEEEFQFGTLNFDEIGSFDENNGYGESTYGGAVNVYSDAPSFRLGNLNENYSGRTDLVELFGGAGANCTKKVKITLTDVHIDWNDNFGSAYGCSAVLKDVEEQ